MGEGRLGRDNREAPRRFPGLPVVGVAGVVVSQGQVLLIKRGHEPAKGIWSIPGGVVEVGEGLSQALAREIAEETGLEVRPGPLVEVVERILPTDDGRIEYHYVILDYLCFCSHAEPKAGDDAEKARWVKAEDLGRAGLTGDTLAVVNKALEMAGTIPAAGWEPGFSM